MKDKKIEGGTMNGKNIWFICNENNAKKITLILMKHGLQLTSDIWDVLPDMER